MSFNIQGFSVSPSVVVALSRHRADSAVTVGRVTMSDSVVQKVANVAGTAKDTWRLNWDWGLVFPSYELVFD